MHTAGTSNARSTERVGSMVGPDKAGAEWLDPGELCTESLMNGEAECDTEHGGGFHVAFCGRSVPPPLYHHCITSI